MVHQLLCLIGGFLWLAATVSYVRRSGDVCLYCGRRDGSEGWDSSDNAARWGRIAVYVGMVVPVIYATTRYAWALGIPLGMSEEHLRLGQERGTWTSGLFLATFGLVGAVLMLGLVQRWDEVFPRWMIGRRMPSAHRSGGDSGLDRVGATPGGRHRNLVQLHSDGRYSGHWTRSEDRRWSRRAIPSLGSSARGGDTGLLLSATRPMQCVRPWRIHRGREAIIQLPNQIT